MRDLSSSTFVWKRFLFGDFCWDPFVFLRMPCTNIFWEWIHYFWWECHAKTMWWCDIQISRWFSTKTNSNICWWNFGSFPPPTRFFLGANNFSTPKSLKPPAFVSKFGLETTLFCWDWPPSLQAFFSARWNMGNADMGDGTSIWHVENCDIYSNRTLETLEARMTSPFKPF